MSLTLLQLRLQLSNLLSQELGTFSDGNPALWVSPPEPPGLGSGLQCIIQRVPENEIQHLNAGQRIGDRSFVVTLTSFDKEASVASPLERVVQRFNVKNYTYMPLTEMTYEQARVLICDPIVFNGV